MNTATTVEELDQHFQHKISKLELTALVLSGVDEEKYHTLLESLEGEIEDAVNYLQLLRRHVQEQSQKLVCLLDLKKRTAQLLDQLQYTLGNIPQNLPASTTTHKEDVKLRTNVHAHEPKAVQVCEPPTVTSYLQFLTVDDFEAIPKYMKGRLTYDKINGVIKQLDSVYVEKYKILKMKKSTLKDVNRKRYEAFKLQENKKTKGQIFIVDQDIADLSSLKMDNTTRSVLTILRHFAIMHEIRGDGFVRFAIYGGY